MKSLRKTIFQLALTMAAALASSSVFAALPQGARAPDFRLNGALGGKPLIFSLRDARRSGPVVLYFFPAAFTPGCTVEAHLFADATEDFKRLGATVVGVTAGAPERVAEFSRSECRDKFAVAADPGAKIAARYQTIMQFRGQKLSERTSFVIAPDGKILLSYTDMNPQQHIERTMAAVRAWRSTHK